MITINQLKSCWKERLKQSETVSLLPQLRAEADGLDDSSLQWKQCTAELAKAECEIRDRYLKNFQLSQEDVIRDYLQFSPAFRLRESETDDVVANTLLNMLKAYYGRRIQRDAQFTLEQYLTDFPDDLIDPFYRERLRELCLAERANLQEGTDLCQNTYRLLLKEKLELGGGMGEFWKAVDLRQDRELLLKTLNPKSNEVRDEEYEKHESRVTSLLQHSRILPAYDTVVSRGRSWTILPYVERAETLGDSIRSFHADKKTNYDELLEPFVEICSAVEAAHSVVLTSPPTLSENPGDSEQAAKKPGIAHRDIKPANILVTPQREYFLIDWGLARILAEPGDKHAGYTSEYASPEQIEHRWDLTGEKTDIFLLGATLYEILTGVAPFGDWGENREPKKSVEELKFPVAVRNPSGRKNPPALVAICEKAMGTLRSPHRPSDVATRSPKEPANFPLGYNNRYESVSALISDIKAYQEHRLPTAYVTEPLPEKFRRWHKRWPVWAALVWLLLLFGSLYAGVIKPDADLAANREKLQAYLDSNPASARKDSVWVETLAPYLLDEVLEKEQRDTLEDSLASHAKNPADLMQPNRHVIRFALLKLAAESSKEAQHPAAVTLAKVLMTNETPEEVRLILHHLRQSSLNHGIKVGGKTPKEVAHRAAIQIALDHWKSNEELLVHSPTPNVRSFLIHRLPTMGLNALTLACRIDSYHLQAKDAGVEQREKLSSRRRALLLVLGGYPVAAVPPSVQTSVVELYSADPDPGIHSAAEWALRQWNRDSDIQAIWPRNRDPKHPAKNLKEFPSARWYVNENNHTMIRIDPNGQEFLAGARKGGRSLPEGYPEFNQFSAKISHRYAIAAHETTVAQFERFWKERFIEPFALPQPSFRSLCDEWRSYQDRTRIGDKMQAQESAGFVPWILAAAYCNWLSEQANLELVYDPSLLERGLDHFGPLLAIENHPRFDAIFKSKKEELIDIWIQKKLFPIDLRKNGYRLPTELEWEFACRAGTQTTRYFGSANDLISEYAVYRLNSPRGGLERVGKKKPNEYGLFDILGNAGEWCTHFLSDPHSSAKPGTIVQDPLQISQPTATTIFAMRGGTIEDRDFILRSSYRIRSRIKDQNIDFGFRVCRTLNEGEIQEENVTVANPASP